MKNLICVSAPSGSGKTTLCKAIRGLRPDLVWSVSCTTRGPRNGEVDGEDYYFKTKEEYNAFLIKNKEIGLLINSVKQRLNSHITKSSKLIQGDG